jgi:hypothetical protein
VTANSSVRQNCFFFASLCTSLLVGAGAVLAKQWLVNYECTGQTGSAEYQSLRRMEKLSGAEAWGLQHVIEILPTFLLFSLGLFFVALTDYLRDIGRQVTIVVLSSAVVGVAVYLFTTIAAAVDPQCPFQSSASHNIRPLVIQTKRAVLLRRVGQAAPVIPAACPPSAFTPRPTILRDASLALR